MLNWFRPTPLILNLSAASQCLLIRLRGLTTLLKLCSNFMADMKGIKRISIGSIFKFYLACKMNFMTNAKGIEGPKE
jgi:ABC-type phosphate transport system auxiliary subunit